MSDVEYSRTGQVLKGRERAKAQSKYEEDGTYTTILLESLYATLHHLTNSTSQQSHLHLGFIL